jgi:hypothetical protein
MKHNIGPLTKLINDNEYSNRRSGRTFRMLLEGIHSASNGKKVIIVMWNIHEAKGTFRQIFFMICCYLSCDALVLNRDKNQMVIIGGGSIRVVSAHQYEHDYIMNSDTSYNVLHDHYQGRDK